MSGHGFRGTTAEQDPRFSNKQQTLRKSINFPADFSKKVNPKKVNMTVIKPWIAQRITDLLGFDDEVVLEYIYGMLESENPDPKDMQINLTGFLGDKSSPFMRDLWKMLINAQAAIGGIPPEILEIKKQEILKRKVGLSVVHISPPDRLGLGSGEHPAEANHRRTEATIPTLVR
ncbi:hypothetical protein IWQ60_007665 [Tieghemiomyces parasiticus]|uniref:PWI domain-containing protein n=1 Tax=Tieghemiomyces parasiticus TaxID=78921 RepID=A0A9W7ZW37_9FUNG|nr:hypothetical protein IWQ60_007665 [Tieghemiomyces parasiticus]